VSRRRKVVREYPDDWSLNQAALFTAERKREFKIPRNAEFKSKHVRRHQVIRVTWKWIEEEK
jgi:hypothetical protein